MKTANDIVVALTQINRQWVAFSPVLHKSAPGNYAASAKAMKAAHARIASYATKIREALPNVHVDIRARASLILSKLAKYGEKVAHFVVLCGDNHTELYWSLLVTGENASSELHPLVANLIDEINAHGIAADAELTAEEFCRLAGMLPPALSKRRKSGAIPRLTIEQARKWWAQKDGRRTKGDVPETNKIVEEKARKAEDAHAKEKREQRVKRR